MATAPKRWLSIAAVWSMAALGMVAAGACSSLSSSAVVATTGILVRAESLTTARGCGRGPTNVFKYAVVVFGARADADGGDPASYTQLVAGNVFDCFADATFTRLPSTSNSTTFRLEVYAYNESAYLAGRDVIDVAGSNATILRQGTAPTWTTQCTATQQTKVQSVALCEPLGAGLTGLGGLAGKTQLTIGTTSFRLPDGRVGICTGTGGDAGGEAGLADAGGDAADGAPDAAGDAAVDAGPPAGPVFFTTARIRYRIGSVLGSTVDVACPATHVFDVPSEPAVYQLDVGLVAADGAPLATTLCTATTQAGATSPAICL